MKTLTDIKRHLTSHTLRATGVALFGERWQAPLAEMLGVAPRTMYRWASGQKEIPAGVWPELAEVCHQREKGLAGIIAYLETATLKGD